MRLAKAARKNPRELAQAIVAALPKSALVASAEVAGAGFINFRAGEGRVVRAAQERGGAGRGLRAQQRRRRPQGDGRVRVGQSHGPDARRPRPRRGVRRDARQPARSHRAHASIASTTSTTPAGRSTSSRSASICAISSCAAKRVAFPSNGYRAPNTSCPWRRRCTRSAAMRCKRPAADIAHGAPPDAPGRRQGQAHRRAHRECAPCAGRAGIRFHRAVRARRDDRRHPQRSRRIRRALRQLVFRARAQPERRHRQGAGRSCARAAAST